MTGGVEDLLQLVDQIADLDRKRRHLSKQVFEIRDKMNPIVSRIELDVAMATDDKGKRIYSNQGMRRAERTLRLENHQEYQWLKRKLRDLQNEEDMVGIEYNRLVQRRQILMLAIGLDTDSIPSFPPDEFPH